MVRSELILLKICESFVPRVCNRWKMMMLSIVLSWITVNKDDTEISNQGSTDNERHDEA